MIYRPGIMDYVFGFMRKHVAHKLGKPEWELTADEMNNDPFVCRVLDKIKNYEHSPEGKMILEIGKQLAASAQKRMEAIALKYIEKP